MSRAHIEHQNTLQYHVMYKAHVHRHSLQRNTSQHLTTSYVHSLHASTNCTSRRSHTTDTHCMHVHMTRRSRSLNRHSCNDTRPLVKESSSSIASHHRAFKDVPTGIRMKRPLRRGPSSSIASHFRAGGVRCAVALDDLRCSLIGGFVVLFHVSQC